MDLADDDDTQRLVFEALKATVYNAYEHLFDYVKDVIDATQG